MLSDILIMDEPFIWLASINKANTVIELSKVNHQQYFLIGDSPESLVEYYQQIDEVEVRRVDLISKASSYCNLDGMDLLMINLN